MTSEELKERFRKFSVRIIRLVNSMPNTIASTAIAKQLVRAGTSPSANYRAACLAKSNKDFLNKLKMVEEEIDETAHWLELIMDAEILPVDKVQSLYEESIELKRIIIKSITTIKQTIQADNRVFD